MPQLDLSGPWTLVDAAGGPAIPFTVPGDTYSALVAAGRLPDPYHGRNELVVQEPRTKDWILERTIEVSATQLTACEVWLTIEELDTIAEVSVNGTVVGTADNQFRRWQWNVKGQLRAGTNTVRVLLKASAKAAAALAAKSPYVIPSTSNNQIPSFNFIRKTQCHAGWDWGICLVVAGIYGRCDLTFVDDVRLDYVYTAQTHRTDGVVVTVTVEAHAPVAGEIPVKVDLGGQVVERHQAVQAGANRFHIDVVVAKPRLWWPNGQGEQHLYDLSVSVGSATTRKRIGLRTIELVNEADDRGVSMTFRVNGRDIFCKGANWIPADAMPGRVDRAWLADLIDSSVDAHMNMLRVWGGGEFCPAAFYELCDEKGLLLWHDFMFACALYPADKAFLANVRQEILHNVKRLRDHASIALWCGDNECVGALNWYPESKANRERYVINWSKLNNVLAEAAAEADPTRTFWPSSPCAGPGDFSDGWHDDTKGDMHYWSVWHGGKGMEAYFAVKPRFCSEFGYQSFSSPEVAKAFCPSDHRNISSPTMELHQKNPAGNLKINEMFARYFRMPVGFDNTLWLSQLQQAMAIKLGVEFWRHQMPTCMGTIYWQLNDNWPVASWSSLEHGGKWKMLHHHARRFFQPVIVTAFQKEGQVQVWAVNDRPHAVSGEVVASVRGLDGKVRSTRTLPVQVPANSSVLLVEEPVATWTNSVDATFLVMDLKATGDGQTFTHRNQHCFTTWKHLDLPKANLKTEVISSDGGQAVKLTSDATAFYAWVNAEGIRGEFADNSLLLLPGESVTLPFRAKQAVTADQLRAALSTWHLEQSYREATVAIGARG